MFRQALMIHQTGKMGRSDRSLSGAIVMRRTVCVFSRPAWRGGSPKLPVQYGILPHEIREQSEISSLYGNDGFH